MVEKEENIPQETNSADESRDEQPTQEELDHHANQMNPNSDSYQDALDNRANQMNPNYKG